MYQFKRATKNSSAFYLDRVFEVLEDALDHARYWNRTFKDAVLVTHYDEILLFLPQIE